MNIRWLPRVRTNSKWDVAPAGAYIVCDSCFEQLEEACFGGVGIPANISAQRTSALCPGAATFSHGHLERFVKSMNEMTLQADRSMVCHSPEELPYNSSIMPSVSSHRLQVAQQVLGWSIQPLACPNPQLMRNILSVSINVTEP